MNTYQENDYRNYLMHWGKGGESKSHKYISRKMGKAGKWIYTYAKNTGNKLSNAWDRSSLSSTGKKRRENADNVWQNMRVEDEKRVWGSIHDISDAIMRGDGEAIDKAIERRNTAWNSQDATNGKYNKKSKKYLNYHSKKYYEGKEAAERGS